MTSRQVSLFDLDEVCRLCSHFKKVEGRFYCEYFQAFLSEETLKFPCDFKEEKKL
ncbi:MAG: hypothetical protein JW702_08000 [Clostridiales bacterium]|nr:hypothetical protein [Clostridiales bacterium]